MIVPSCLGWFFVAGKESGPRFVANFPRFPGWTPPQPPVGSVVDGIFFSERFLPLSICMSDRSGLFWIVLGHRKEGGSVFLVVPA